MNCLFKCYLCQTSCERIFIREYRYNKVYRYGTWNEQTLLELKEKIDVIIYAEAHLGISS